MNRKIIATSLLLLLLLSLSTNSAIAKQMISGSGAVTFQATALWSGLYRESEWAVVDVDIYNGGPAFAGVIDVASPLGYEDRRTDFRRPVEVSSNTSNHFRIYVCLIQQTHNLNVSLIAEGGQTISESNVQVNAVDYGDYTVGVVTNTKPAALPGLNITPVVIGSRKRVKSILLSPDELPDRTEGLSVFNALVLNDIGPNQLNQNQYNTLINWTAAGGRLIIGPQNQVDWNRIASALGPQILPVQTAGSDFTLKSDAVMVGFDQITSDRIEEPLPASPNNPLTFLKLAPKATATPILDLKQSNGQLQSLVVASQLGLGWIIVGATDPFNQTVVTATAYWNGLLNGLGPSTPYDPPNENILTDRDLARSLLSLSVSASDGIPTNVWFFLVLGLYLVLVIPLNFLIWQKFRRTEFSLVSVPLSAVLVTGLMITLGSDHTTTTTQGLNIVQFNNTVPQPNAWISSYLALRSNGSDCQLTFQDTKPLLRPAVINTISSLGAREADAGGFVRSPEIVTQQPYGAQCDNSSQGQLKMLTFEDWQNLKQPIAGKLQLSSQILSGKLTNQANYTLENTTLVFGENYQPLGTLKPQQQLDVKFDMQSLPGNFPNPVEATLEFFKNDNRLSTQQALYQASVSTAVHLGRFGAADQLQTAYIIGWVKGPLASNGGNQALTGDQTYNLVIEPVEFDLAAQPDGASHILLYRLPPQLFMPRLLKNDAQPIENGDWLNSGSQIREYHLPPQLPATAKPQALLINLTSYYLSGLGTQSVASIPEIAIYNWKTDQWRVLAAENSSTKVVNAPLLPDELEPQTQAFRLRLVASQRSHLIENFNVSITMK